MSSNISKDKIHVCPFVHISGCETGYYLFKAGWKKCYRMYDGKNYLWVSSKYFGMVNAETNEPYPEEHIEKDGIKFEIIPGKGECSNMGYYFDNGDYKLCYYLCLNSNGERDAFWVSKDDISKV